MPDPTHHARDLDVPAWPCVGHHPDTPPPAPGTKRCRRCDWRGDDLPEHARDSGHPVCVVCQRRSLTDHEAQTCMRCVTAIRADILDTVTGYTNLPPAIAATALHPGTLPGGDALVLSADGSLQSPQTPNGYTEPHTVAPTVHLEHPELPGHPAYVESRIPSDRREHVRDHWAGDPVPVLAVLEANERDWRRTYGDPPATDLATVTGCSGYLLANLEGGHNAAQTHPAIDEFATEVRALNWRVSHVAGLANDPMEAEAECFDCAGPLIREYRPPGNSGSLRKGLEREGLPDEWTCRRCQRTYTPTEYMLAVRAILEERAS